MSKSTTSTVKILDCIKGMKSLKPKSVDVVVTSPPYNIGKDYNKYMDRRDQEEYIGWCREWVAQIARVLKDDGSFFLNLGSAPSNPTIPHELLFNLIKSSQGGKDGYFTLQNTFHWIKSITVLDDDDQNFSKGHFKPINSHRYVNDCHEYIFHLTHNGDTELDRLAIGVEYKDKSNTDRWSSKSNTRCRGNTWFIPYETIKSRAKQRPHPATFPTKLPEWCIRLHGDPTSRVVMDPFLGLGSSWVAAIQCKSAEFIGFDIDDYYIGVARERAENAMKEWCL